MSIKDINQEYLQVILDNYEANVESGARQLDYILNSSAKYHGRCVRTYSVPKIFDRWAVDKFTELLKVLYGIFDKVISRYLHDAEYRKLFGFDARLEELILTDTGYSVNVPIARIDVFFNEETGDFKFCEFNTDGSSAMNEDRELCKAVAITHAYRQMADRYSFYTCELFDSWVDTFEKIYREYSGGRQVKNVAIVDFMENATENEFAVFADSFAARGINCEICDIRQLVLKDSALYTPNGMKVEGIYRRAVTSDIMKNYDEVTDFITAVKTGCVCLVGGFRTQIVHNKLLYKILHLDETMGFLTQQEKEFVKRHVPYTVSLDEKVDLSLVFANKDSWIIKPEDSYGSQGVHAGVEYEDEEEFRKNVTECVGKGYILQEFCKPYVSSNIDLLKEVSKEPELVSNLTGLFVYGGEFAGIYSRISKSEIISTQYSEMAVATLFVGD